MTTPIINDKNHMEELLNISTYCNLHLDDVIATYNSKIHQNIDRVLRRDKDIYSVRIGYEAQRVLNVMTEYASRKLGYPKD